MRTLNTAAFHNTLAREEAEGLVFYPILRNNFQIQNSKSAPNFKERIPK